MGEVFHLFPKVRPLGAVSFSIHFVLDMVRMVACLSNPTTWIACAWTANYLRIWVRNGEAQPDDEEYDISYWGHFASSQTKAKHLIGKDGNQ